MNPYFINTPLGGMVIMADTAHLAEIKYLTEPQQLKDMFVNRENLIERGYTKLESTLLPNVWLLIK